MTENSKQKFVEDLAKLLERYNVDITYESDDNKATVEFQFFDGSVIWLPSTYSYEVVDGKNLKDKVEFKIN